MRNQPYSLHPPDFNASTRQQKHREESDTTSTPRALIQASSSHAFYTVEWVSLLRPPQPRCSSDLAVRDVASELAIGTVLANLGASAPSYFLSVCTSVLIERRCRRESHGIPLPIALSSVLQAAGSFNGFLASILTVHCFLGSFSGF